MANRRFPAFFSAAMAFVSVPWAAFVAVFLYAVVLTVMAISVDQLSTTFMVAAYTAPLAVYGLLLLARTVRAIAALPSHLVPSAPRVAHV